MKNYPNNEGNCVIHIPKVQFDSNNKLNFKPIALEGKFEFSMLNDQYTITCLPDDDTTKGIAHQLEQNSSFRKAIERVFGDWNVLLQAGLEKTAKKYKKEQDDEYE